MLYEKWVEGWNVMGRFLCVSIAVWACCIPLTLLELLLRWLLGGESYQGGSIILRIVVFFTYVPFAYYWASEFSGYLQSSKTPDKLDLPAWKAGALSPQRTSTEQKTDSDIT